MKRAFLILLPAVLLLASCVVTPTHSGYGVAVAPPLPSVVILDTTPYYYHSGFYYYYHDHNWRYSKSKSGPWQDLPRSHWPKEIRHKDRDRDRDRDHDRGRHRDDDHGRGGDRDRDWDDRYDRDRR